MLIKEDGWKDISENPELKRIAQASPFSMTFYEHESGLHTIYAVEVDKIHLSVAKKSAEVPTEEEVAFVKEAFGLRNLKKAASLIPNVVHLYGEYIVN